MPQRVGRASGTAPASQESAAPDAGWPAGGTEHADGPASHNGRLPDRSPRAAGTGAGRLRGWLRSVLQTMATPVTAFGRVVRGTKSEGSTR
jgi:hypothetical protein